MSQENVRIPNEITKEVLDLASQYYAEYQDGYRGVKIQSKLAVKLQF